MRMFSLSSFLASSVTQSGGHVFQFADTLWDASFDDPLTLVDDLVNIKTHSSGGDESSKMSRKVLRVHVGRPFKVRERRSVGVIRVDPRVDVVLEEGLWEVERRDI